MRYFGGMTAEETADALKVSVETVGRDWTAAKRWLYAQLNKMGPLTPESSRA